MNNEGWSFFTMIVFCFIFLFGLTISTIIYNKSFGNKQNKKDSESVIATTSFKDAIESKDDGETKEVPKVDYKSFTNYEKLEIELSNIASNYINTNNIKVDNYKIIISLNELINKGYIKEIKDPENNSSCKGYAIYDGKNIKSYIKCMGTYQTDNYNKDFE